MKIIKWLAILGFAALSMNALYWIGFAILFSYGAGNSMEEKIEMYEFNTTVENFKDELQMISNKSIYLSYQVSVYGDNSGNANTIRIFTDGQKLTYFLKLNERQDDKDIPVKLNLYFINGKGKDDFGWFSNEKYKKVKLFEETIIDPLSKKFERIEVKD